MLTPYRVIDCTDDRGQFAGLLLAQLGAEVVLVEPPGGSPARRRSPRVDQAGAMTSAWHWGYNRGKRSVVCDLTTEAGRQELLVLAASADVLLWSGRPREAPVTYDELAAANPALVVVFITPFGLDGPKAGWADADLVVSAAACQLALTGDSDRPPLRMGSPQAYLQAGADAAVAALVGLAERRRSGRGQLVDVSAQVSCLQASFAYSLNAAWGAPPLGRTGDGINMGAYKLRWTYPALDGEVSITFMFGAAMAEFTGNLFQWIWEEGGCDEATRDKPWADLWAMLESGEVPADEVDRLADVVAAFTATRPKAELAAEARRRRALLAPIATLREVLDHDHLAARGFWDVLPHPADGRPVRVPGRFVVASGAPLHPLGPPPGLGECSVSELLGRRRNPAEDGGPPPHPGREAVGPPLQGLKVLDLTWSIAGPLVGRTLADLGATVVKVESQRRPDFSRTASPFHPRADEHPLEGSGVFANCNAGKLGLELDLSTAAGREVLWDLVRWADVVVESFSAGTLERMGFGYARLAEANPGIILLSTCLPGQTGTLDLPGYGNLTTALFGFTTTTRWPDRPAAGPFGAYTDVVSPRLGLLAVLAALDWRRRTGRGQHLDLSQAEAALHFLTPALLDTELNGHEFVGRGNDDDDLAPHGVYPTTGDDRWVAIACTDDAAWRRLARHVGRADLADLDLHARLARRRELDEVLAAWTADQDADEVQVELQGLGVAAHQVQNTAECLADPQLGHRRHYVEVEHPLLGPVVVEGPRFRPCRTPGATTAPGPTYGQHNDHVLTELLGYDQERITDLVIGGAFG